MEVLHLTATQFIRPMSAGRTCPVLLGAEDPDGKTVEVVRSQQGHDLCARTAEYLREAREERTAFVNFVKYLLR
jgi:hypothetical protein